MPGTAAGDSTFVDDDRAFPAHDEDDDEETAEDATAVASVAGAAAAAAGVGTDMGIGIGIGTAATGTGIDIGDWTGVFGVALPGAAVPYRWDDMYHQNPGLAVCLHVVFNHSFIILSYRHYSLRSTRQSKTLFLSSSSFAFGPTIRFFFFFFKFSI